MTAPGDVKHLWESKHSYYCNEGQYFGYRGDAADTFSKFETWASFIAEEGDADMDYNLVFRWDWMEDEGKCEDPYYRNGVMKIFYMTQRKGFHRTVEVRVCRADENAVREFLMPLLEHLIGLWAPLTTPAAVEAK